MSKCGVRKGGLCAYFSMILLYHACFRDVVCLYHSLKYSKSSSIRD